MTEPEIPTAANHGIYLINHVGFLLVVQDMHTCIYIQISPLLLFP